MNKATTTVMLKCHLFLNDAEIFYRMFSMFQSIHSTGTHRWGAQLPLQLAGENKNQNHHLQVAPTPETRNEYA